MKLINILGWAMVALLPSVMIGITVYVMGIKYLLMLLGIVIVVFAYAFAASWMIDQ